MTRATPVKSIRLKCLDCSCGQPSEVRFCPVKHCPLYPYRLGKRPLKQKSEEKVADSSQENESKAILGGGMNHATAGNSNN